MGENKTIVKNSAILYIRLLITSVIGLYASRIILLELGADDFGLYAVVGGIVSMLNVLNTTMIATSNRYLAVEIGRNDRESINKTFNTLMVVHLIFGLVLILFLEILGVWYIKNYLNVDPNKISDALFVLHFSGFAAVIGTVIVPFQGLITSYEKFNVRATIEILQSALNLLAVSVLMFHINDKLKVYAFYVFSIQLVIALIYIVYSKKYFRDLVKWKFNTNKSDYKGVSKFFGWQMVYIIGSVGTRQGSTLIMNVFFGTVLNAAFGIASKVNEFIFSFVKNLNQAALPQIMKSYSSGNQDRSLLLIYKLSKFTFFIMLIPAVPIMLSIDMILELWLKDVPAYTAIFVLLRVIHGLISCLESGFDATIDATGRIKKTKFFFAGLFLLVLPIIYLLYQFGFPPYIVTIVYIIAEIVFLLFQTSILTKLTKFKPSEYISLTILPVIYVSILIAPQYALRLFFGDGVVDFLFISIISVMLTVLSIYFAGLNRAEKLVIREQVANMLSITKKRLKRP